MVAAQQREEAVPGEQRGDEPGYDERERGEEECPRRGGIEAAGEVGGLASVAIIIGRVHWERFGELQRGERVRFDSEVVASMQAPLLSFGDKGCRGVRLRHLRFEMRR